MKNTITRKIQDLIAAVHWDLNVAKESNTGLREGRLTEAKARRGIIEGTLSAEMSLKEMRREARKLSRKK